MPIEPASELSERETLATELLTVFWLKQFAQLTDEHFGTSGVWRCVEESHQLLARTKPEGTKS